MIDLRKEFEQCKLTVDELIQLMPERTIEYFLVRKTYKEMRAQKKPCEDCYIEIALMFNITEAKVTSILYLK